MGVREPDVRERNAAELGDRLTDGPGEVAPDDAEVDVDERGLDGPVGEHEHGGQEVHVDPLGALVSLDAPAGVGDADGRGDDGAAHAGPERRQTPWRPSLWTVISRSATNGRDWLLM